MNLSTACGLKMAVEVNSLLENVRSISADDPLLDRTTIAGVFFRICREFSEWIIDFRLPGSWSFILGWDRRCFYGGYMVRRGCRRRLISEEWYVFSWEFVTESVTRKIVLIVTCGTWKKNERWMNISASRPR